MTANQFEDLRIWQDARIQANSIYDSFGADSVSARDFGFRDQIQRCGVSVMNNIAEGFQRESDKEFARFLDVAKGSNGKCAVCFISPKTANIFRSTKPNKCGRSAKSSVEPSNRSTNTSANPDKPFKDGLRPSDF
jgi:four helix bundle protein